MGVYHEALMTELKNFTQTNPSQGPLDTIYIGGGTPSTWPNELLLDMSGILKSTSDLTQISEITLEANPGTVTKDQIPVWQQAGINRLSIGVQSLDDQVLAKLNRHQKVADVYNLLNLVEGQFKALSVDLIIGLPGVSHEQWKQMIKEIVTWPIQHISMYFLSIHENTPLYKRLIDNEFKLPPEDPLVDLYHWTVDTFGVFGLEQYEISSFARNGFQAKHNQIYWDRKPYKGFGIGACSFDGQYRFQNDKNVMRYMKALKEGKTVVASSEKLEQQDIILEKVMLGLRRMKGLEIEQVLQEMGTEQRKKFLQRVKEFEEAGIVTCDKKKIYLKRSSIAVENEVAVRLLQ